MTIRGYTNSDQVASVQVNGFTLSSFNGSTWRYHAFERFGTLNEGTNQYKVDYIGANGAVLYTDYFTIVKKLPRLLLVVQLHLVIQQQRQTLAVKVISQVRMISSQINICPIKKSPLGIFLLD